MGSISSVPNHQSSATGLAPSSMPPCASTSPSSGMKSRSDVHPLSVRIALVTDECARRQRHDVLAYYHHHSAKLESELQEKLKSMDSDAESFIESFLSQQDYAADQHHKLLDKVEKYLGQQQNSSPVSGYTSGSPPGRQGNLHRQSSARGTLSTSPVILQEGLDAPCDVDHTLQAMPSLPPTQPADKPLASAPRDKSHGLSHHDGQDINLGSLPRARTQPREMSELDTLIFSHWYTKNIDFPYPLPQTTDIFVAATGLQKWQVDKWFNNKRTRDKNTRKFPVIVQERKARLKRGDAWLKQQDDLLKRDIAAIKANYSKNKRC